MKEQDLNPILRLLVPTSPFFFGNNGRNSELASVMSSLKKQNKEVALWRHSQERVLHEGQHDRRKCYIWCSLQEAHEVIPPGSSALGKYWLQLWVPDVKVS